MNEDQFSVMLAIIVPPIIEQITKNSNIAPQNFRQCPIFYLRSAVWIAKRPDSLQR